MRTTFSLTLLAFPLLAVSSAITPSPTLNDIITVCNPFTTTVTATQPALPCAEAGNPCTTFGFDPCCKNNGDHDLHCQAIDIPGISYQFFGFCE